MMCIQSTTFNSFIFISILFLHLLHGCHFELVHLQCVFFISFSAFFVCVHIKLPSAVEFCIDDNDGCLYICISYVFCFSYIHCYDYLWQELLSYPLLDINPQPNLPICCIFLQFLPCPHISHLSLNSLLFLRYSHISLTGFQWNDFLLMLLAKFSHCLSCLVPESIPHIFIDWTLVSSLHTWCWNSNCLILQSILI